MSRIVIVILIYHRHLTILPVMFFRIFHQTAVKRNNNLTFHSNVNNIRYIKPCTWWCGVDIGSDYPDIGVSVTYLTLASFLASVQETSSRSARNWEFLFLAEWLSGSLEGLCFMELRFLFCSRPSLRLWDGLLSARNVQMAIASVV
jgi:hypothetical protein